MAMTSDRPGAGIVIRRRAVCCLKTKVMFSGGGGGRGRDGKRRRGTAGRLESGQERWPYI